MNMAVFSEISNAGSTCRGYEHRRPKLYISLAVIVTPLCGRFKVTISEICSPYP